MTDPFVHPRLGVAELREHTDLVPCTNLWCDATSHAWPLYHPDQNARVDAAIWSASARGPENVDWRREPAMTEDEYFDGPYIDRWPPFRLAPAWRSPEGQAMLKRHGRALPVAYVTPPSSPLVIKETPGWPRFLTINWWRDGILTRSTTVERTPVQTHPSAIVPHAHPESEYVGTTGRGFVQWLYCSEPSCDWTAIRK